METKLQSNKKKLKDMTDAELDEYVKKELSVIPLFKKLRDPAEYLQKTIEFTRTSRRPE